MIDQNIPVLAALVCVYSLFEFLVKRICWPPSGQEVRRASQAASRGIVLLIVMVIGTSGFITLSLGAAYLVLAAVSSAFELVEGRQSQRGTVRKSLERYTLKQLVALSILYMTWRMNTPVSEHEWFSACVSSLLGGLGTHVEALYGVLTRILVVVTSYLFVIDGGTRIVRGILNKFPGLYARVMAKLDKEAKGTPHAAAAEREQSIGEWIGILERIITLTFVLTGNFTAIAFALTAKSIARFKELENKEFAEYYLLGTSGSLIVALSAGMLARLLFGW